ncbi:MAG: hypothetical protein HOL85_19740 [Rhodospirillaceae bacterium]|jgi:UDP-2,4-diacetamido-2,4,6-trideoxy-beta-L-altropyranose hydrolase|nr:hypothetical protein [Rhodospirillaceae bacterium]MBT6138850.1 hypothetical protein [Rhodospirillaceae bacterium]
MDIPSLIIRVDADQTIGTGHAMRCLALAQAWVSSGGEVTVSTADMPDGIRDRYRDIRARVVDHRFKPGSREDASWTIGLAHDLIADWTVVDGPAFGPSFFEPLSTEPVPVLLLDDQGALRRYSVRLILNQNRHSDPKLYQSKGTAGLLLGLDFVLLRQEFNKWRDWERPIAPIARNLLVVLGGADPENRTKGILRDLATVLSARPDGDVFSVRVIVGAANPRAKDLALTAAELPMQAELLHDVSDMAEQYSWCDLAISSAGSAVWELAMLGTPMILGAQIPVEEILAHDLARTGACLYLGPFSKLETDKLSSSVARLIDDPRRREAMSQSARGLVDGQGAERVVRRMREITTRARSEAEGAQ